MEIFNAELAIEALRTNGPTIKFVMNSNAILFFSRLQEHRDLKAHGLSYEDDYKGNAVAGLITDGKPEIRFHKNYPDAKIKLIWDKVQGLIPDMPTPSYQGRMII